MVVVVVSPDGQAELEDWYLDLFWRHAARAPRLRLLIAAGKLAVPGRPATWRATIRAEAQQTNYPPACWSCSATRRRLNWHHIVWVANGGSNRADNLVAICDDCHEVVHPWLRRAGWSSLHDIIGEGAEAAREAKKKA